MWSNDKFAEYFSSRDSEDIVTMIWILIFWIIVYYFGKITISTIQKAWSIIILITVVSQVMSMVMYPEKRLQMARNVNYILQKYFRPIYDFFLEEMPLNKMF